MTPKHLVRLFVDQWINGAKCVADIYEIPPDMPMTEKQRQATEQKLDELSGPYAGSS